MGSRSICGCALIEFATTLGSLRATKASFRSELRRCIEPEHGSVAKVVTLDVRNRQLILPDPTHTTKDQSSLLDESTDGLPG